MLAPSSMLAMLQVLAGVWHASRAQCNSMWLNVIHIQEI
jgi:hypothetical protein